MAETKHDKFVRLSEARTNKIIDMVQLLGNLSNTSVYEYDKKEIDLIFEAIESEVKTAHAKFEKREAKGGTKFSLK